MSVIKSQEELSLQRIFEYLKQSNKRCYIAIDTASIIDEVGKLNGVMPGALGGILTDFIDVINRHLRRGMLVSSFISALLFFAVYWMSVGLLGNHGLWLAQIVYLAMRGIVQTVWYREKLKNNDLLG